MQVGTIAYSNEMTTVLKLYTNFFKVTNLIRRSINSYISVT